LDIDQSIRLDGGSWSEYILYRLIDMETVSAPTTSASASITARYVERTPGSAALMTRAGRVMPAGSTRTFGFFRPYPVVFERGAGSLLWDVDGNRYVDFAYNGLSLIHGHAYAPAVDAVRAALARGSAWPGTSREQVAFAELLVERIEGGDQVRFANTGTEATMLGVKLARHVTGRPLVLKAWDAYHGSFDDLEAGLGGRGELAGRTLLARFGDLDSFERKLAEHQGQIAAVVFEPIMYTDNVIAPPPGFLPALVELAHRYDALAVLDDCLMFRLAPGGSAERYGFRPDITCLGKWIGGGLPVGAIVAREELMRIFDPTRTGALYHGGSFNGNPLGCAAGRVAVEHLTFERIAAMEHHAERIADALRAHAETIGLPLRISGDGSALGVYVLDRPDGDPHLAHSSLLHLAATNHGVYLGAGGEMAMATSLDHELVDAAIAGLAAAIADVAAEIETSEAR
jgi:glutamate-1-semialdehyde 2,1-aminomutase